MSLTSFSDGDALSMMMKIEEAAAAGDVDEAERLLLILEESRNKQRIAMKNLEMQERETRERILNQRGARQSQFRIDSMVFEKKALAEQLEKQTVTDIKVTGAVKTLTAAEIAKQQQEERRRRELEEQEEREEAERDRLRKEAEERRLDEERRAEERRMVALMERAEERLQREEMERKKKEREARRQQDEKKEQYRRSMNIRISELQEQANQLKTGQIKQEPDLLTKPRTASRASRRSGLIPKQPTINPEAVQLISKVRDESQAVSPFLTYISQNPTSDKIAQIKPKVLTAVTSIVQGGKTAADKLRWEGEEYAPGVLNAIRDVVQSVKLFTQALEGNYDERSKRLVVPKASDGLGQNLSNLVFSLLQVLQEKKQFLNLLTSGKQPTPAAPAGPTIGSRTTAANPIVAPQTQRQAPQRSVTTIDLGVARAQSARESYASPRQGSLTPRSTPIAKEPTKDSIKSAGRSDTSPAAPYLQAKSQSSADLSPRTSTVAPRLSKRSGTIASLPTPSLSASAPPDAPMARGGPPAPGGDVPMSRGGPPPPGGRGGGRGPPPPPGPMGAKKQEEAGPPLQISLPPPPAPTVSASEDAEEEDEDGPLPADYTAPERPEQFAKALDLTNPAHIAVLAYIEQLEDDYETLSRKYEKLRRQAASGVGGSTLGKDLKTIQKELAEMQAKLFDPSIDPADAEVLNIEYEKITQQMEKMPEYITQQKKEKEKWARDNYELNRDSFSKVVGQLQGMPGARRDALLKKETCLGLLTMSADQIKKKYKGDWISMTPHNLTLDQARAVFCILPEFRPDQAEQLQFVENLKQKIEDLQNKKPVDKPIKGKPLVFKKPRGDGGGGGGGFFEELLQKRKKR